MTAHIFIDTMVWLHYQPVTQIEWTALLGTESVHIVVPRVTIRELDLQKNQHSSSTIRQRAGRVLAQFEEWFETDEASVREATLISRYSAPPSYHLASVPLDPSWNDDTLLASLLSWQEATGLKATLVTQDTGPTLTAKDLHIRTLRLSEDLRLPPALEGDEREIAYLKRELLRLQAAQPILTLGFPGADTPANVLRLAIPAEPERAEAAWGSEREALAAEYPPVEKLSPSLSMLISASEFARYKEDRFKYLEDYREYQIALWEHRRYMALVFAFEPTLSNTGTQPGDDIDVLIQIPDPLEIHEDLPEFEEPERPEPPERPRTSLERASESLRMPLPHVPNLAEMLRQPVRPNVSKPMVKKAKSHDISYKVQRVKHGTGELLSGLKLRFPARDSIRSFQITYTISAANLIDSVSGVIHVIA